MRLRFSIKNALTLFALTTMGLALLSTWQTKQRLEAESQFLSQLLGQASHVGVDYDSIVLFKTFDRELVAVKVTETSWDGQGPVIQYQWAKTPEGNEALAILDALLSEPFDDNRDNCGAGNADRFSPTIAAGPVAFAWDDAGDDSGYLSPIGGVHAKPCLIYRQQSSDLKTLKLVHACWEPFDDLEKFDWSVMLDLPLPLDEDTAVAH